MGAEGSGRIAVTGGTGFVGANVRRALRGRPLRLVVRDPSHHEQLRTDTTEIVAGDVTAPATLDGAFDGCGTVIHLVGIIDEGGTAGFDQVIRRGTIAVVGEAERAGVSRIIFVSALGARDDPAFPYLQAKWRAEQAVRESALPTTILRPSVMFGPGDGFLNPLAHLVRAPVTPIPGDGSSRFMPVSVADVAEIIAGSPDRPGDAGALFELGGARVYTLEQMVDAIRDELDIHHPKVHVPRRLIAAVAALASPLPARLRPPVTREQLKMLAIDNVTADNATPRLLGRPPLALENGLQYLRKGADNSPPA